MLSFAFLLIVVDDAQEWGRKRISELYVNKDSTYEFISIVPTFDIGESDHGKEKIKIHSLEVKEEFSFKNQSDLRGTLLSLYKQCKGYKEISEMVKIQLDEISLLKSIARLSMRKLK